MKLQRIQVRPEPVGFDTVHARVDLADTCLTLTSMFILYNTLHLAASVTYYTTIARWVVCKSGEERDGR